MNIDSNLLKEFAKITNDSEVKTENKYLRGTIVKNSGGKYVQLDGSTTVTPISELVDVEEGDRVLVSIENHKATIVGNFTFPPSARKEQEAIDKSNAAQESASKAETTANAAQEKAKEAGEKADTAISQSSIASASADEAKQQATEAINKANDAQENVQEAKDLATQASTDATEAKNQAAASQASSAEAQAEVTRLQGEVDAAKEDVDKALEDLETQAGEITAIKENYATKVEVGDTKAELETTITKKVGELETSISETYSTKTENVELEGKLQTQITQNSEGLTSQASKIEKIESDTTQAQKDVADALTKANAAQSAADSAQATASAAQTAADQASADAADAASKATIAQNAANQATAAANAADQAVQAAQGDLNEAKQNLASVTSRVDATEAEIAEAQQKVDAAQTSVNEALADAAEANAAATKAQEAADKAQTDAETAQGVATAAQTKADNAKTAADNAQTAANKAQADVAALTSRVTTAETKIEQNNQAISLNASKTEEIGTKVDNLEIGGRNLILNSRTFVGDNIAINQNASMNEIYKDLSVYSYDNSATASGTVDILNIKEIFPEKLGAKYTLSFYAKGNGSMKTYFYGLDGYLKCAKSIQSNGTIGNFEDGNTHWTLTDEWTRYWVTWILKDQGDISIEKRVLFRINFGSKVDIAGVKLEVGDKNTDWTPAPEDIENELATNYYTKTQTDAQIKVQSDRITSTVSRVETVEKGVADAQTAADAAQADIDNLEVGGRNLLFNTKSFDNPTYAKSELIDETYLDFNVRCLDKLSDEVTSYEEFAEFNEITPESNGQYIFSFYAKGTGCIRSHLYDGSYRTISSISSQDAYSDGYDGQMDIYLSEEWERYWIKFTLESENTLSTSGNKKVLLRLYGGNIAYVCGAKFEKGNKATDWTPAPEDIDESIDEAQTLANTAQETANANATSVSEAHSLITQLANSISTLVTDENGTSLMTQNGDSWTFNMSSITGNLEAIQAALENKTNQDTTTKLEENLKALIAGIEAKTAYINIGTDDSGSPCIELGESTSDFKVRITNTAIDFMEGSSKIAYANNNTFYAEKMIVKNELQIGGGPGFVWRTRSNGNMGLVYISG